jgi:phosphogluconate dehydratase
VQNRGFKVALLTDGRMSGASGKILAAIQATPEAARGGLIGKVQDGDIVTIDANSGEMSVAADGIEQRESAPDEADAHHTGIGRELFQAFRERATSAEEGGSFFGSRP